MNTKEILSILKSDQAVGQILLGVFPLDKIPIIKNKPSALVINMDPSYMNGSHWIAMFFDKNDSCDYFDSYGKKPSKVLEKYMFRFSSKIRTSLKQIQNNFTSTCGQLCIYFLIWRSRGVPLKTIMSSLDQGFTDEYVTGFVNNLFKVNTVLMDEGFIINQLSTIKDV